LLVCTSAAPDPTPKIAQPEVRELKLTSQIAGGLGA
jgi:hypothetical protein